MEKGTKEQINLLLDTRSTIYQHIDLIADATEVRFVVYFQASGKKI